MAVVTLDCFSPCDASARWKLVDEDEVLERFLLEPRLARQFIVALDSVSRMYALRMALFSGYMFTLWHCECCGVIYRSKEPLQPTTAATSMRAAL